MSKKLKTLPDLALNVPIVMKDIDSFKPDPKNPRKITKKDAEELKANILRNPKMMRLRPIAIANGLIKAGEKRWRACVDLGYKKVPTVDATKLSKSELENFMLWDNYHSGSFDLEELKGWQNLHGLDALLWKDKERHNNSNAEMPIVPVYDEKHRAVIIVVETESDFANLCTILDLGRMKDYKSTKVGQSQVIAFKDFMNKITAWKKSK